MKVEKLSLPGLLLITLKSYPDDRGFFCERFKNSEFANLQLPAFVQDNFSRSKPGVVRGLHYQWHEPQGKLVTCLHGKILDVAVDIRVGSPTFGAHVAIELSGDLPQWLWVPAGFAHGFTALGSEAADVNYRCDKEYNPHGESGLLWSDPALGIPWPEQHYTVSAKDKIQPVFAEYIRTPKFQWSEG